MLLADTTEHVKDAVRDIRTSMTTFVRDLLTASPESQIQLGEFQGASTVRVKFTPKVPDLESHYAALPAAGYDIRHLRGARRRGQGSRETAVAAPRDRERQHGADTGTEPAAAESLERSDEVWRVDLGDLRADRVEPERGARSVLSGLAANTGGMRQNIITASRSGTG